MKHLFYSIAILALVVSLNSCTADEIETEKPKVQIQAEVDPATTGVIPPKK